MLRVLFLAFLCTTGTFQEVSAAASTPHGQETSEPSGEPDIIQKLGRLAAKAIRVLFRRENQESLAQVHSWVGLRTRQYGTLSLGLPKDIIGSTLPLNNSTNSSQAATVTPPISSNATFSTGSIVAITFIVCFVILDFFLPVFFYSWADMYRVKLDIQEAAKIQKASKLDIQDASKARTDGTHTDGECSTPQIMSKESFPTFSKKTKTWALSIIAANIGSSVIVMSMVYYYLIRPTPDGYPLTHPYLIVGSVGLSLISLIVVATVVKVIAFKDSVPDRGLSYMLSFTMSNGLQMILIAQAVVGMIFSEWDPTKIENGSEDITISASMDYLPGAILAVFGLALGSSFLPAAEVLYGRADPVVKDDKEAKKVKEDRLAGTGESYHNFRVFIVFWRVFLSVGLMMGMFFVAMSPLDYSVNTAGLIGDANRAKWTHMHFYYAAMTFGFLLLLAYTIVFETWRSTDWQFKASTLTALTVAAILLGPLQASTQISFPLGEYIAAITFSIIIVQRYPIRDFLKTRRTMLTWAAGADFDCQNHQAVQVATEKAARALMYPYFILSVITFAVTLYVFGKVIASTETSQNDIGGCKSTSCVLTTVFVALSAATPLVFAIPFKNFHVDWITRVGLLLTSASIGTSLIWFLGGAQSRGAGLILGIGVSLLPLFIYLYIEMTSTMLGFYNDTDFFDSPSFLDSGNRYPAGRVAIWMIAIALGFLPTIEALMDPGVASERFREVRIVLAASVASTFAIGSAASVASPHMEKTMDSDSFKAALKKQPLLWQVSRFLAMLGIGSWIVYIVLISATLQLGYNTIARYVGMSLAIVGGVLLFVLRVLFMLKSARMTSDEFRRAYSLGETMMFMSLPFSLMSRYNSTDTFNLQQSLYNVTWGPSHA